MLDSMLDATHPFGNIIPALLCRDSLTYFTKLGILFHIYIYMFICVIIFSQKGIVQTRKLIGSDVSPFNLDFQ